MPRCELRALRRQDEDREEPVSQLALFGDVPAVGAPARTEPTVDGDGSRRSNGHAASLTLAEAARIIRKAVKDKSYRKTPLGQLVGRYLRWFRNEYGATESTIRDYEAILARMSLLLADREPLEVSTEDLREVIDTWAMRHARTRAKVTSVIRAFWSGPRRRVTSRSPLPRRSAGHERRGKRLRFFPRTSTSCSSAAHGPRAIVSRCSCSSTAVSGAPSSAASGSATSTLPAASSPPSARARTSA